MKMAKTQRYKHEFESIMHKFRTILYPDIGSYAEGAMSFLFEAKFHLMNKEIKAAKTCWERSLKFCHIYEREYDANTIRMKQKGSKNRFFHKRNRISGHSRCPPAIINAFAKYIESILRLLNDKRKDYNGTFYLLTEALRNSSITIYLNHMIVKDMIKILT
jgi:hypothetical protein